MKFLLPALLLSASVAAQTDEPLPPPDYDESEVIASLGPVSLRVVDLDARYQVLPPPVAKKWAQSPRVVGEEMTKLLLERAVAADLRAGRVGPLPDAAAVESTARAEAIIDAWLRATIAAGAAEPTDAEVSGYYQAHPERFLGPRRLDIEHVYVSTVYRSAEAAAEELEGRLADLAGPGAFTALVDEYGDPSNQPFRGGSITMGLERGQAGIDDDFLAAAFALDAPGAIAGPVRSRNGVHLIHLLAEAPAETLRLDQVRHLIVQHLRAEAIVAARDGLLDAHGGDLVAAASAIERTPFGQQARVMAIAEQAANTALVQAYRKSLGSGLEGDLRILARERFTAFPDRFAIPAVISYRMVTLKQNVVDDHPGLRMTFAGTPLD
ncbi:MAG: peptidyl-prolyl cis-trans isomerase, partial [Pseudomonadota bacterium]